MNKQQLFETIQKAEIDLRVKQNAVHAEAEARIELDAARRILRKFKISLLRGEPVFVLGDPWSFSTLRWILSVIRAMEGYGISVLYAPPASPLPQTPRPSAGCNLHALLFRAAS